MAMRPVLTGVVLSMLAISLGCSSVWTKNAITIESTSSINEKRESLVVLFPGFKGKGIHYEQQGILDAMREHGFEADLMTINVKPRIYFDDDFADTVRKDIMLPAKSKGYKYIYLMGISMGGHGVLLYATKYPEDIDALFVVSPFISGSVQSNAIVKAGGIENWDDCPFLGWDHACRLWKSLKEYVSNPKRGSNVFLGYGNDDIFVKQCRILAGLLPPENVFTVDGEHDWVTWKKLWLLAMDRFREFKAARMAREP